MTRRRGRRMIPESRRGRRMRWTLCNNNRFS